MSKIKVTVEYESPPEDKFAALMAEYKAAKAAADEAKSTIQPMIDAGFAAKHQAILDRLYKLGENIRQYAEITGCNLVCIHSPVQYLGESRYFKIAWSQGCGLKITVSNDDFTDPKYASTKYFVESWNRQTIESELRQQLEKKWQSSIESQMKIPQDLQNTLARVKEG